MPRCVAFAPELTSETQTLTLSKAESHHIAKVLRARVGQVVKVLNGRGLLASGEISLASPSACQVEIQKVVQKKAAAYPLCLAPTVIKGKSMDNVIRMATELGVTTIQPIYSQHGDVPLSAFDSGSKIEKWRTVAIEACKQCENPWLPEVRGGLSFSAWLASRDPAQALVYGSLVAGARDFRGWRASFEEHIQNGAGFDLAIGPEGDFSPEEYAQMSEHQGFAVFLGRCILRSETATPALLAGLIASLPA